MRGGTGASRLSPKVSLGYKISRSEGSYLLLDTSTALLKKQSATSGRKRSSSLLLYVSCIAGSFHASSTRGEYQRVAAVKNAPKSPVAMISSSQSEKCFNLSPKFKFLVMAITSRLQLLRGLRAPKIFG